MRQHAVPRLQLLHLLLLREQRGLRFSKSMSSSSDETRPLLPPRRVLAARGVALVLDGGEDVALGGELDVEVGELVLEHEVLGVDELQLLLQVGEHLHRRG